MPEIKYPDDMPETTDLGEKQKLINNHLKDQARKIREKLEEKEQRAVIPRPEFKLTDAKAKFDEYIAKVDSMFDQAKAMIVNSDVTNVAATELGTSAMALFKKINATKEQVQYYTEAKEYVDAVDSLAAMLTEKLYSVNKKRETIVSITKAKISEYSTVLEAQRRKQEQLEQKAREDLQKKLDEDAKQTGTIAPKVGGPLISSKKDTAVRTQTGTAYAVHSWEFEVKDKDLVTRIITEMLSLVTPEMGPLYELSKRLDTLLKFSVILWADAALRKAVKDGIRNIEGINIFEKTDTRFKTS